MEFKIEYSTIIGIVEEVVSREAGQAYTAEGGSLYDAIHFVSRDDAMKGRLMEDALVLILESCNRFLSAEVVEPEKPEEPEEPEEQAAEGGDKDEAVNDTFISFTLELSERRAAGKTASISTVLKDIAVNFVAYRFFAFKNQQDLAAKYQALALSDVQTLTRLLYTKNPPKYPTKKTENDDKDSDNNPA